jgi:hypothetical protein
MLYTRSPNRSRYPFETVKAANAWLEAALEGCSKRVGGSDVAGVTLVVRKLPALLWRSVPTLQRNWEFMQAPAPDGLGFNREQACAAVISHPAVWCRTPERIMQTVKTLAELGVADAPAALARNMPMLGISSAMLRAKAKVLRDHELDAGAVISNHPQVLNLSANTLDGKLQWLLHVAGCCAADLQSNTVLLTFSLPGRMRPRFFLAMQLGVLGRCKVATLMAPKDAAFLAERLRGTPAASWSEEAYKQHIASPEFLSYVDSEEAALRAQHATSVG